MHPVRVVLTLVVCLQAVSVAAPAMAAAQAPDPGSRVALYRLFLTDGTTAVSYGEYARVGDDVVFSMPLGRSSGEPRLVLVTLPAGWIDWARTVRYAETVRFRRYIETRAEADFAVLSARVADMLDEMAAAPDPAGALAIADRARQILAAWPSAHYGYRQDAVREIIALIDEAVSGPGGGRRSVQVSLVAPTPAPPGEPLLDEPSGREQIAALVTLAHRTPRAADRMALLRAARAAAEDPGIPPEDAAAVHRSLESQLRVEEGIDGRYAAFATRLVRDARRAAARADVGAVERAMARVTREDERLGGRRPQVVLAVRAELNAQLLAARDLHRRREDWRVRRPIYQRYVARVGVHVTQLVKVRGALEAIRDGDEVGPAQRRELEERLRGGVTNLEQMAAPEALRPAHDMLIGAWRFAEAAETAAGRAPGDATQPGTASSAAAGALLLLSQAQEAMRTALEPPGPS